MTTFLPRWLAALALVMATYNPTQWNYAAWGLENYDTRLPLVALLGLLLLTGYVIFLTATFRSIGILGVALVTALLGAALWVLTDWELISITEPGPLTWVVLIGISLILGIGMSWSIANRELTGQSDVDETDP
jgi:hypothetical protein